MMLGVMPFEQEFFAKYDLPFKYVGTPQADRVKRILGAAKPWPLEKTELPAVGFFPGSRESEFIRMAPAYLKTLKELKKRRKCQFFMSIGQEISMRLVTRVLRQNGYASPLVQKKIDGFSFYHTADLTLLCGHSMELMSHVDTAIVTSGTATLECGLIGTPLCVAYKTSSINYAIAKRVVTLPNIALINIVAEKRLVEEFVQDLDPLAMANELEKLTFDNNYRDKVKKDLQTLHTKVHGDMGVTTARTILDFIHSK
jgi:lipid-A-disaccharide synthase